MTSLFNHSPQSRGRVIQIKPVDVKVSPREEQNKEKELADLKEQIEKAYQDLDDVKEEKAQMMFTVEKEIEEMKAAWMEEKKVMENDAYQKGMDQGFQQGYKEGHASLENRWREANDIVQKAKSVHDRIVIKHEETMVEVAMKAAEKILNTKLKEDSDLFLPVVQRVIEEVKRQPEISLYVHPAYYGLVHSQIEELERLIAPSTHLTIYAKGDLDPFSCVVESPFGKLDGSIDTQLNELRQQLLSIAHEEMGNG
ncbi:flagellar assembly protein FliH [Halobacillus karajensis]|uniref:flagellar assembly protein FliH n=1 Tax=Halobacillus karajensis TaxID=195088 RepID=UPI0008A77A88|nr:flagellar assembly protein FliH [Halobacillus karajensis]SEH72905.1 flagellar assembly protein FliH [Halobacillus karajensis]